MGAAFKEGLSEYMRECKWLAGRGFLDGEGLYLCPGVDAVPLLYARGNLTGLTMQRQDVIYMARTLELIGHAPDEVFGRHLGSLAEEDRWEHYTQCTGDVRNPASVGMALKDRKFDYIVVKGTRRFAFMHDPKGFERLLRRVHKYHAEPKATFLLASADSRRADDVGREFLKRSGYEDITLSPAYADGEIEAVRRSYPLRNRAAHVSTPPETTDLGIPWLAEALRCDARCNALLLQGNFRVLRKTVNKR